MTRLLVSPPTQSSASAEERRQWDRFIETLLCASDVVVERIEPRAGDPGSVFTANAALISGGLAIMSTFRDPARRRQQRMFRSFLARSGFATAFLQATTFEGAGDALFDRVRPMLYVGHGRATERAAAMQIAETLAVRTLPLMLIDERFAHLDACLCPLGSGHVLAYMDAFSPHAQRMLRRTIERDYLIDVSLEDAHGFACNAVEVGDAVVLHGASERLRDRLNAAGYRVFSTDLSAFHLAGGSAKRLTLNLEDGPARGEAAA